MNQQSLLLVRVLVEALKRVKRTKEENAVSLIGDAVRDAVADASQSPSVSVVSTQRDARVNEIMIK